MKKFYVLAIIITFCFLCYRLLKPNDMQIIAHEEEELVVVNTQEEDSVMGKTIISNSRVYLLTEH